MLFQCKTPKKLALVSEKIANITEVSSKKTQSDLDSKLRRWHKKFCFKTNNNRHDGMDEALGHSVEKITPLRQDK